MRVLFFMFMLIITISSNVFAEEVTLREKIGQMLMIGFQDAELHDNDPIVKAILAQEIGGVILFDYNVLTQNYDHNIKNPEQVRHLTQQLQHYTNEAAKNHANHLSPLLIGIDYEGGKVNRLKDKNGFPKTLSAADIAKLSYQEATAAALQMAQTLKIAGINFNFAPVLDVNVNPDSPAIGKYGRSFSADPEQVAAYTGIFSRVYKEYGIICSYKHFPGHGSATGDTHKGFVDVTQTWKAYELEPYEILLHQYDRCPVIMSAHVVHNGLDKQGLPATISKPILQGLLREKMGFDGVIITDDMQMGAITDNYGLTEAIRMSINAGADILMFGNQLKVSQDPKLLIDIIYEDVKAGKIPESRIEESYQRIMKLKSLLLS